MKTILVVDDLASVRLYHVRFLTQKGFRCLSVGNGAEALETLRKQPVDLILLDMVMPDMDGPAFLARLAVEVGFAKPPVLAITTEALKAETRRVTEAYGAQVLMKPLLPDALLKEVNAALAA